MDDYFLLEASEADCSAASTSAWAALSFSRAALRRSCSLRWMYCPSSACSRVLPLVYPGMPRIAEEYVDGSAIDTHPKPLEVAVAPSLPPG